MGSNKVLPLSGIGGYVAWVVHCLRTSRQIVSILGSFARTSSLTPAILLLIWIFQLKLSPGQVHGYVHQTALKIILLIQNNFSFTAASTSSFITFPVSIAIFKCFIQMLRKIISNKFSPSFACCKKFYLPPHKQTFPLLFQSF